MVRKNLAIFALFLLILPCNLAAAEVRHHLHNKKVVVDYTGRVNKGDLKKLRNVYLKHGYITKLRLSSPGGSLYEAFRISNFIRTHNIMTHVKDGDMCFSACFDIYIGGALRSIAPKGKIGSHMHSLPLKIVFGKLSEKFKHIKNDAEKIRRTISEVEQLSALATARRIRNLIKMGVSYRAIDPLIETSFFDNYFYNSYELKKYNIINIQN